MGGRPADSWQAYTTENLFQFLHQLAAIMLVGGLLAVSAGLCAKQDRRVLRRLHDGGGQFTTVEKKQESQETQGGPVRKIAAQM